VSDNLLATVLEDDSLTVEILPMGFAHKVGVSNPLPLAESHTSRSQPAAHCLFTPCATGFCSNGRKAAMFKQLRASF